MKSFPQAIKSAMEAREIKQAELARRAGITKETIGLVLKGESNPHVATKHAIASALGFTSVDELMESPQNKPIPTELREEGTLYGTPPLSAAIAAQTGVPQAQVDLVLAALAQRLTA